MLKEVSLAGKHAVVTGGASGLGLAITEQLLDAGALVTMLGRRADVLENASNRLGPQCRHRVFDVTQTDRIPKLFAELEAIQPVDILVNNAGINNKKDYFDFTGEEFDQIVATQAKAPFMMSQEAARHMKQRGKGSIILISSLSALLGMHQIQAYTVCKAGMLALARSLARDLSPFGIRVNSLNPGFVLTDMLKNTNTKTPERLQEIQNKTPLRGFTTPKDIGMAAAFLASDAARFITGIDLVVDGGISRSFLL